MASPPGALLWLGVQSNVASVSLEVGSTSLYT
uniref:Uncharacterized protein n=1 Tax=Anguilla anguilla TaxID=7936 RepID=A0A0E9S649_ANGAN